MSHRYQIDRKPGNMLRVVDRHLDQVDGLWIMDEKRWFDLQRYLSRLEDNPE